MANSPCSNCPVFELLKSNLEKASTKLLYNVAAQHEALLILRYRKDRAKAPNEYVTLQSSDVDRISNILEQSIITQQEGVTEMNNLCNTTLQYCKALIERENTYSEIILHLKNRNNAK